MHWLAPRRRHQSAKLVFLGFDSVPIADQAPFVMEPYANREKLWIELDGGAVGIDRLREPVELFERRAHVRMRLGEIRAQRKGFAISLDRRLESLLALQEIAEFGEDLGEIRPQRERLPVGLDGLARLAQLLQDIAEAEIGFGRIGPVGDDPLADGGRFLAPAELAQHIGAIRRGLDETGIERGGRPVGGE